MGHTCGQRVRGGCLACAAWGLWFCGAFGRRREAARKPRESDNSKKRAADPRERERSGGQPVSRGRRAAPAAPAAANILLIAKYRGTLANGWTYGEQFAYLWPS